MIDILASRYASLDFMRDWDFAETASFILYVVEQRAEEKVEQRWIMHYQDQMSFEDFKAALKKTAAPTTAPLPLIEADVEKILSMKVEV